MCPFCWKRYEDRRWQVREEAARALSPYQELLPLQEMLTRLTSREHPHWQLAVIERGTLAHAHLADRWFQENLPREPLERALGEEQEDVRVAALWALSTLGRHGPREHMLAALGDSSAMARSAAPNGTHGYIL